MSSEDVPTVRPSGSIATFERIADELLEKLGSLSINDTTNELRRDVKAIGALFRSWKTRAPTPEERASAITRLMDLHRAIEEYAAGIKA